MLQDIEQDLYLERVNAGTRFANFLIDSIAYYGVLFGLLTVIVIGTNEGNDENFLTTESPGSILLQYLISFGSYLGFFTLMEGSSKGKTLGKLITGTRAIQMDGNPITWKDAFMRSLCRVVPFEAFSGFTGFPWHDKWTNTIVTKERK